MDEFDDEVKTWTILQLRKEIERLRKTLACIALSPEDPEWVSETLNELEVDSDTWNRWLE
tara:strand:+ start:37 stop:216 length:180 start_codon:yes stop_codon:yes gene_type:complete